jgi:hypothetical protein
LASGGSGSIMDRRKPQVSGKAQARKLTRQNPDLKARGKRSQQRGLF